jgi:hypothetical protein
LPNASGDAFATRTASDNTPSNRPMTERIPYARKEFKGNFSIHQEWRIFDGPQGCTPLAIDGFGLRMDRLPPPLPVSVPPPDPTVAAESLRAAGARRSIEGIQGLAGKSRSQTRATLHVRERSRIGRGLQGNQGMGECVQRERQAEGATVRHAGHSQGMVAMGFSKGRIFAERWFNGRAFVGPTNAEELNGAIYPEDMIDNKTIKTSWLLGFKDMEEKYDDLEKILIYSPAARKIAKKCLAGFILNNPRFNGTLLTKQYCNGNIQKLHHQFQFQRNMITDLDTLKNLAPTDLTASLGSFSFLAAIASADIATKVYNRYISPSNTLHCTQSTATITHIWIYAKDSYSFQDDDNTSQYLGHWNKSGLIVLPAAAATAKIGNLLKNYTKLGRKLSFEAGDADIVSIRPTLEIRRLMETEIYTSIRNKNYIDWRKKHNRGGDFVIYSDLKKIELDEPISISLDEICI